MTQQEIKDIMSDTRACDIDMLSWLKMILAKVNEWKSKL